MSGFIGGGFGFGGADRIMILEADDRRLQPTWWELERPIYQETYRTRFWPRAAGLDGGILEAVWYEQPELAATGVHSPLIGGSGLVSGTLYVQLGKGQLVSIEGFNDVPTHIDLTSQRFSARSKGIFDVGPNPLDPYDSNEALLTAEGLGDGTLFIRADGDPGRDTYPLSEDVPVTVYTKPTHLVVTYSTGGEPYVPIPIDPDGPIATLSLPLNSTALVKMEGQDDDGNVTALKFQDWTPGSAAWTVTPDATNPSIALITPVSVGSGGLFMEAVGDANPGGGPAMTAWITIEITATAATHFVVSSAPVEL